MFLTTERLILREFAPDDWRAVLDYQSDPRYLRFYEWTQRSEADVRAFVQMFCDQQREEPRTRFQLAIVLREDHRLIGNVGIRKPSTHARVADIGYELAPNYWGHGYATEAARAIVAFGFQELRLHRVWAHCLAENVASAQVLEKLDMQREGHLREIEWFKDRWWDTLIYAVLEQDWRARHDL